MPKRSKTDNTREPSDGSEDEDRKWIEDRRHERYLQKLATNGVTELFNAVAERQRLVTEKR